MTDEPAAVGKTYWSAFEC